MMELDELPSTVQTLFDKFNEMIVEHQDLHHTNRLQWKKEFWSKLKWYQLRNYASKHFPDSAKYKSYLSMIHQTMAETHRSWTWWNYVIDALKCECCCADPVTKYEENDGNDDVVCLEVDDNLYSSVRSREEDVAIQHRMNAGVTLDEVREETRAASLYLSMKKIKL